MMNRLGHSKENYNNPLRGHLEVEYTHHTLEYYVDQFLLHDSSTTTALNQIMIRMLMDLKGYI